MKINPDRCKEIVYTGTWSHASQCSRKPKEDGYCKQHHPDSVKARKEKRDARWDKEHAELLFKIWCNSNAMTMYEALVRIADEGGSDEVAKKALDKVGKPR